MERKVRCTLAVAGFAVLVGCGGANVCAPSGCASTCPGGLRNCDGACVNTDADPLNCGDCSSVCDVDQTCVNGGCENYRPAPACTACPCPDCGRMDCCTFPATSDIFCIGGGEGCPW